MVHEVVCGEGLCIFIFINYRLKIYKWTLQKLYKNRKDPTLITTSTWYTKLFAERIILINEWLEISKKNYIKIKKLTLITTSTWYTKLLAERDCFWVAWLGLTARPDHMAATTRSERGPRREAKEGSVSGYQGIRGESHLGIKKIISLELHIKYN